MSLQIHNALGWLLVIVTLAFIGFWVPREIDQLGSNYLIFFFHFPSAINCMNLFIFAGVVSLTFLLSLVKLSAGTRKVIDILGIAGIVGLVFYSVSGRLFEHKLKEFMGGTVNLDDLGTGDKVAIVALLSTLAVSATLTIVWIAKVLATRRQGAKWDFWAASAVEVGMLACTVTLVTGAIWARAAWGDWSTWAFNDPRLLSVYIMWFIYAGYLSLRSTIDDLGKRERFCAVFGVIAMVNVPIVYMSIRIFGKENHPMALTEADPAIRGTQWFGALAFLVLYVALWRLRYRVHLHRHELNQLQEDLGRVGI